jgi:hypothetical protein
MTLVNANNYKLDLNKVATSLLVPLMIISAILAETVFKGLQILSELFLLTSFLILILKNKLDRADIYILVIYFSINFFSIFYLSPKTLMLNLKQFGLPILALIYFKRNLSSSKFLPLAFVLCIILMISQRFLGYFPLPINQYITTLKDDFEGRPLGLFLNYHFSAFFVAVYLIGFTFNRKLYSLDYLVLFFFGVQTSILSYAGQKIFRFFNFFTYFKSLKKTILLFLTTLYFFLFLIRYILDYLDIPEAAISGLVIFYQLTDIQTYIRILNLLPSDIYEFYKQSLYSYTGTKVEGYLAEGNEISFIQIVVQGGLILGLSFLNFILKNVSIYRIFILLSLIHYSYLFSPLIIYTMCFFENKNKKFRDA